MAKALFLCICSVIAGCRHVEVIPTENLHFGHGLYVLNEGNMGSNKASIDFYDIDNDTLYRNIYPTVNPQIIKELGDVGNDIAIYGGKMYAVINVSGKVEVMDLQAKRIGQVDIPNCRSIVFHEGYAYVSSYAGPVQLDENYKQRGYVAKIDTVSLHITDTCLVGYQPNGLAAAAGKLYVANSGGYMAPNYDSTLSVIDLKTFKEVERITIAKNLNEVVYDEGQHRLIISAQGDYYTERAMLYQLDPTSKEVKALGYAGRHLQMVAGELRYMPQNISQLKLSNQKELMTPYGYYVDPENEEMYVTDARDYVTPGVLYRYSKDGQLISKHRTGDIPGHFALKR